MRFPLFLIVVASVIAAEPNRIFYSSGAPTQAKLFVSRADGSDERPLLKSDHLDYNPAWSPDGQWIAFTSERDGPADLYRVRPDGTGLERLTNYSGYDDQAAFSPDSNQIVFVTTRGNGHANLWILDLRTHLTTPLTSGQAGGDFRPSWSPDGNWIAFSSDRGSALPFRNGSWEHLQIADIYLIHPDGSGLKRLSEHGNFCGSPKWTRDSRHVIAYCMSAEETFTYRLHDVPRGETRLVSIDGASGKVESVAAGPGVKIAPNVLSSGEVAYIRKDSGRPGIFYGQGKPGPKGAGLRWASWSPDGERVVYHRFSWGGATAGRKRWSRNPEYELHNTTWELPSFDPSGQRYAAGIAPLGLSIFENAPPGKNGSRRLLYGPHTPHPWHLILLGGVAVVLGTLLTWNRRKRRKYVWIALSLLLFAAAVYNTHPYGIRGGNIAGTSWSPRGDSILFSLGAFRTFQFRSDFTKGRVDGGAQVAMIKPDGSGFQVVTSGANNNAFPSFAPDGRRFVYRTAGPEGQGLRIMDLETSSVATLTTGYDTFPRWSPRGDLISFVRQYQGDFEIFTIRPDGSDLRRLTVSPGNDAHGSWSPDGEWIVFTSARMGFKDEAAYSGNPQPYGELFVMRYDGTDVEQLTDDQWEDGGPAWQPAPKGAAER